MTLFGIDDWKKDSMLGIGVGVLFIMLNMAMAGFVLGIPDVPMSLGQVGDFLIKVVVAPVAEEILFRGIILAIFMWVLNAERSLIKTGAAITITSIAFALFHIAAYGVAFQTAFVGAFVVGVVCGVLTITTRNILPAIWVHTIFNGWLWVVRNVSIGGLR